MSIFLGNTKIAGGTGYHPNIFDIKWSDHVINDIQWLRADTFSWQSGLVYKTAYNHLASDISGKALQSETISSITIQYYLADDGHKICPASQESNILSLYNTFGVAWYYILDDTNTRFKLPRTKYGFEGLRNNVGNKIDESLPDHQHYLADLTTGTGAATSDNKDKSMSYGISYSNNWSYTLAYGANDASGLRSGKASVLNSTYKDGAPVQERATQMYLYFYVGEYSQSAIEQTAGLSAELFNGKMDNNLANTNALTNCILEDPQNIKLELNSGTLTLKAGSVVCIPNGFESDGTTPKFDEVEIESDITYTYTSTSTTALIFYNTVSGSLWGETNCSSGSTITPTTTYVTRYDTTLNKIKRTTDGSTWSSSYDGSLPIALVTFTSGTGATSIDQTFQSIGYIGSTVFVRKGLKVLVPNGRNEDGSLKNVEYTTSSVLIQPLIVGVGDCEVLLRSDEDDIWVGVNTNFTYNESKNSYYYYDDGAPYPRCLLGTFYSSNGTTISNFKPYTATNILKYSDSSQISAWAMPSGNYLRLTLGASGSNYTAPANGWFIFKKIGSTDQSIGMSLDSNYMAVSQYATGSASYMYIYLPVKKGDVVNVTYSASGALIAFGFIYAEGEV